MKNIFQEFKEIVSSAIAIVVDKMAHPINQGENSLILYKICTFAP